MKKSEEDTEDNDVPDIADHHYLLFSKEFTAENVSDAIEFIIARNLMIKRRPAMIKMIINSPGGEPDSAFALIDTIKGSKIPVYTYGIGELCSCGLMTFIAGEKGHRYITPNTSLLSHQYSWGSDGKSHELMARVKEFKNLDRRIINLYKTCTGLSEKEIKKYLLPPHDVWLTAEEAIKFNIADHIIDFY